MGSFANRLLFANIILTVSVRSLLVLEKNIQKKILNYLRQQECCFAYKIITANINGLPDIACIYKGKPLFFEVKRDSACKPTPLQVYQHEQIKACGGGVWVVSSLGEVKDIFAKLDKD